MARAPRYNPKTGELVPLPLPYSSPHLLYLVHGTLPGGETWSIGLRTEAVSQGTPDLQLLADYAARSWAFAGNISGGWRSYWSPNTAMTGVTVRSLNVQGVTLAQAEGAITLNGTGNAQTCPDQTALVISLHTARAGRSGKGRVYLPITVPLFGADAGKIDPIMASGIQASWDSFLQSLNVYRVGDAGPQPTRLFAICVQSRVNGLAGAPVQRSLVGNVLDTQRRRRQKLRETYTLTAANYDPPTTP